jgi:hypothetical protein
MFHIKTYEYLYIYTNASQKQINEKKITIPDYVSKIIAQICHNDMDTSEKLRGNYWTFSNENKNCPTSLASSTSEGNKVQKYQKIP